MKPYLLLQKLAGRAVATLAAIVTIGHAHAAFYDRPVTGAPPEPAEPWYEQWWNGKYASGNWFGVRDTLEDRGLKLGGRWIGVYYGVVDGGRPGFGGRDRKSVV